MKDTIEIKCDSCGFIGQYDLSDYEYVSTPDGIEDDYVECDKCNTPIGSSADMEWFQGRLPEYPEPDEDAEYERGWEDQHIRKNVL